MDVSDAYLNLFALSFASFRVPVLSEHLSSLADCQQVAHVQFLEAYFVVPLAGVFSLPFLCFLGPFPL